MLSKINIEEKLAKWKLLLAYIIFHERLNLLQIIGVILIMGAVLINEFLKEKRVKNG